MSSNPNRAITFTFGQITSEKVWNPSSSQLWIELYDYCSSRKMALALNNPQRLICKWTRNQTKPSKGTFSNCIIFSILQEFIGYLPSIKKTFIFIRSQVENGRCRIKFTLKYKRHKVKKNNNTNKSTREINEKKKENTRDATNIPSNFWNCTSNFNQLLFVCFFLGGSCLFLFTCLSFMTANKPRLHAKGGER